MLQGFSFAFLSQASLCGMGHDCWKSPRFEGLNWRNSGVFLLEQNTEIGGKSEETQGESVPAHGPVSSQGHEVTQNWSELPDSPQEEKALDRQGSPLRVEKRRMFRVCSF